MLFEDQSPKTEELKFEARSSAVDSRLPTSVYFILFLNATIIFIKLNANS